MQPTNYYDIIIIGAGPAGLSAACAIDGKNNHTLILEKNESAGKKLLLTGNGRCNICHTGTISELLEHFNESKFFLKPAFFIFPPEKLFGLLQKYDIDFITEKDGRIFPSTEKAKDVLSAFLKIINDNNINFIYNSTADKISVQTDNNQAYNFIIVCSSQNYYAKKIILAGGGSSYPQTGSDGNCFHIAADIGHAIINPEPGLTPLIIQDNPLAELSGISFSSAAVKIIRKSKTVYSDKGELLITHKGLSGPIILNSSRFFKDGDFFKISFSGKDYEIEKKNCVRFLHENSGFSLKKLLIDYFKLSERFILYALNSASVSSSSLAGDISKESKNSILEFILNYTVAPKKSGFENAMITIGGVSKNLINPKTLESRIIPKLFFAGEIIDYDADTGGFNLFAAIATGFCAGFSASD